MRCRREWRSPSSEGAVDSVYCRLCALQMPWGPVAHWLRGRKRNLSDHNRKKCYWPLGHLFNKEINFTLHPNIRAIQISTLPLIALKSCFLKLTGVAFPFWVISFFRQFRRDCLYPRKMNPVTCLCHTCCMGVARVTEKEPPFEGRREPHQLCVKGIKETRPRSPWEIEKLRGRQKGQLYRLLRL